MEPLTVPGVKNLGYTCFFASLLQALASCEALLASLESALELLPGPQLGAAASPPLPPPAAAALASELLSCLRRLQPQPADRDGGGSSGSSFAPRELLDLFRSRLPEGVLSGGEEHDVSETAECLCGLVSDELHAAFVASGAHHKLLSKASLGAILSDQPLFSGSVSSSSSSRGDSSRGDSSRGDGSSAASSRVGTETGRADSSAAAAPACHAEAGDEASVLTGAEASPATSSAGAASDGEGSSGAEAAGRQQVEPQPVPDSAPSSAEQLPAQDAAPAAAGPVPDPVLHAWASLARLPLRGSTAHELKCLTCFHSSSVQVTPSWVLPLGLPVSRQATLLGNVPVAPGADLEGCLDAFFARELVQGVHCTRCSLAASLEAGAAALEGPGPAPGAGACGDEPRQRQQQQEGRQDGKQQLSAQQQETMQQASLLERLRLLKEAVGDRSRLVLQSDGYRALLESAGLAWVPRPSPAAKRTVAAALPRVLCLQLRRGFWSDQGHHCKLTGHVSFPLVLPLPTSLVPRLGEQAAVPPPASSMAFAAAAAGAAAGGAWGPAQQGQGEEQQEEGQQRRPVPLYLLRSVLVHHGGLAGGGHYTVFRCLDSLAQQAQQPGVLQRWVGASDEEVRPAGVREVLAAEASMLVYERWGAHPAP